MAAVEWVDIWAVEPGGYECSDIQRGEIRPDDLVVLSKVKIETPFCVGGEF